MAKKILIDTDPGVDDAMAILLALRSPELEVIGLTTVFGNSTVDFTAQNGLRLVELEGNGHIPVAQGASRPLIIEPRGMGQHVHGQDGMGNTNPPPPLGRLQNLHAAEMIVVTALAHPGEVTLVAVGPLTNLALALRLEPRLPQLFKEVVIMGGSAMAGGNASPVAEANICNDPHAAAIVFSAGWSLTMVGLDVTLKCIMSKGYLDELGQINNPACKLITSILPFYQAFHHQVYGLGGAIHTHDPSAIAYLIDPSLFRCERLPVYVVTEGRCAGQTVPDPRRMWEDVQECNVCLDVEAGRLLEIYHQRLSSG
jgi:uridine nucleosidase